MKYWRIAFFIIGVLVFFAVMRQIAFADFAAFVRTLDWRYAVFAFVAYLGVNTARVERIKLLFQDRIARDDLFSFVFIQNFLNVFFSFSGDAAYMALVHRTKGISIGENIAAFVSAKVLDVIVLTSFFLGGVFISASPALDFLRMPALLLFICVAVVGSIIVIWPKKAAKAAVVIAERLGIANARGIAPILTLAAEVARGFSLFDRRDVFLRISFWTLVNWSCTFLAGWFLLYGAHIALGVEDVLFAYTFPITAALTPFYVFGGFGSYEVSFLSGLVLVGIDTLEASRAAVAIHAEELIFLLVCAVAGLGLRLWKKKN